MLAEFNSVILSILLWSKELMQRYGDFMMRAIPKIWDFSRQLSLSSLSEDTEQIKEQVDEIRSTISPETKMQMELSVAIANRIYDILEAKGMSQKDFARILGKTETEVSRWLSGTQNLTLSTISKISIALGEDIIAVIGHNPYHIYEEKLPSVAESEEEYKKSNHS